MTKVPSLAAARLWAATRFPYLASALFGMTPVEASGTGGMRTDERWRLYVDPEAVARWPVETLGASLVHHAGHLLRDHAERARTFGITRETAERWTAACDAEINDDIEDLPLPPDSVTPEGLGCEPGRFAEEYYRAAPERPMCDCGSGCDGRPRADEGDDGTTVGRAAADLIRRQVAAEVIRHAKEAGTVPGGLLRWAAAILEPAVDWRRALAAEIRAGIDNVAGAVDYSYRRPSRRQSVAGDVILPSLRKPVPNVAVVCDTSGSMHEGLLARVLAEVEGLLRSVGVARSVRVLSVDAAVHAVRRVTSARQVELIGGGGTNMGTGIEAALRLRPRPQIVVVLTDGYTPWPDAPPKGARVVVAQLDPASPSPPRWVRTIVVDEVA